MCTERVDILEMLVLDENTRRIWWIEESQETLDVGM